MKILHGADLHKDREHYADLEASLDVFEAAAIRERVDLIALAGDLYDGAEQNSERDMLDPYAGRLQRLGDIAPVVMIYGTPSHDVPGSLDILQRLACKYGITILQPGQAYFYDQRALTTEPSSTSQMIIFGIPEPAKKWLLAGAQGAIGKDLVDQAVRDRMRALCLGLGGMRREHADLPCLVLYHGQVSGARTGTGYEAGSGIAISRDDLAAIEADYYALGDIHFPQQVGDLPAYYPGKFYPGDWKEQGYRFGCNLVRMIQVDDPAIYFDAQVSRIDFPHPEQVKLERKTGDGIAYKDLDLAGRRVWEEWTLTTAEANDFDAEAELEGLIQASGALPGSQVTVKRIPVETVRAAEITERPSLEGKLAVYAEASALTLPAGVYSKAAELEREVGALEQRQGAPRRFRNVSTLLRGAKGFWRRQHKDEVFIDWESYGPGLVAYVGPNGFGKTTSFDFSKPWPVPTSRKPKTLKAHFRLRDSVIENVYLEEISGTRYKVHINIDGANKSGGAEYFLFLDEGQGWRPVDGCTGRQEPFLDAIDRIFGSMDVYMRTAYVAQKASKDYPDISEATIEEKKALIGELAGKDYAPYQGAAKAHGDEGEADVGRLDATIAAAADVDETLARLREERGAAAGAARAADEEVAAGERESKGLSSERDVLALRVADVERRSARRAAIDHELEEVDTLLSAIAEEVQGFTQAAGGRAAAQVELDKLAALETEASGLRAEKAAIDKTNAEAMAAYQREAHEVRGRQDTARADVDSRRRELAAAEQALALVRARVDPQAATKAASAAAEVERLAKATQEANEALTVATAHLEELRRAHIEAKALLVLTESLAEGGACPVCGSTSHPAPAHADSAALAELEARGKAALAESTQAGDNLLKTIRDKERALAEVRAVEKAAEASAAAEVELPPLQAATETARGRLAAAEEVLAGIILPPPAEPTPFLGAERLAALEAELGFAEPEDLRQTIRRADEARVRIEEAGRRRQDAEARQARLGEERAGLAISSEEEGLAAELAGKDSALQASLSRLSDARSRAAAARATIEAKDQAIADTERRAATRAQAEADRKAKAAELEEWRTLERALVGVRDLELDALAPSIAEIATRLLQSAGDNGRIEIETTRISSGSAKRAKQIEDFLIFYTGEDGEQQDIGTCSGGEMVWQRKALYDAFAVMRSRNAGIRFQTCLLDETDGALHPTRKQDYFRMLAAAHKESDRFQTILITQSNELAAMAQTIIDVATLGPSEARSQEVAA